MHHCAQGPTEKWEHLAFVYDKNLSKMQIFVDGVLSAEDNALGNCIREGTMALGKCR